MLINGKALGEHLVVVVKDYVGRATAALGARVESIEKAIADLRASPPDIDKIVRDAVAAIPKPKDGEPGKDADAATIIKAAADAVAALPKPQDGKSVTLDEVRPILADLVKAAVAEIPKPADGKDASPEEIHAAAERALAALPKPENGKDADPEVIKAMVAAAVAALPTPPAGKDAEPETIRAMVAEAVAEMPKPADGKSVTLEEVQPVLAELVATAVKALPTPKDGEDADLEVVRALVQEEVAKLPPPAPGKDADAEKVAEILLPNLKQMIDGWPKPKDGSSVTLDDIKPMFEAEMAKALLDIERRAQDTLQRAVDKFPVPKDGRDAIELDDLQVEHDGEGGVTLRFARGELRKEFTLQLPRFKDCGVWREPQDEHGQYRKGDGVTWACSYFIAQKDAPAGKPGEGGDWRLAVKRGRDGKDAKMIEDAAPRGPVRLK